MKRGVWGSFAAQGFLIPLAAWDLEPGFVIFTMVPESSLRYTQLSPIH